MADLATQSANPVANKPASTIGGNAPPTPPETQEVKSANPATTLPASADEATKANETSSVPVPASTSETEPSKALGETETTAPVNGVTAESGTGTDSVKAAEAQADQLAAQPEKPSDNLSSAPINAEPSAAAAAPANEELSKEPPKPVSLEEVSDPEGPATKLKAAEDVVKPDAAKAPEAAPVPEERKDAEMTEEQPTVTTGPSAPEAVPAVSEPVAEEPKTGQKRKAEEPAAAAPAVNGNKTAEQQASPEKKQKVSPITKVAGKVTNTVKKVGRPKKEKKEPAPVGKTARKTRSQGKADE